LNRPIPTQPVPTKKQKERHPALLPVLAVLAGLGAVAAYLFVEDNYFKPNRDAENAKAAARSEDPMFVPVDQFMDTMSIRSLDFTNPNTIAAITARRHEPFKGEPLNLGDPKTKAVRELGIRREVPPYEEQITIWFIPDRTPTQVLPDYYYKILRRNFQLPVSYTPGESGPVPFPGSPAPANAASSHDDPPQPPPPSTRAAETEPADLLPNGINITNMKLPEPEMVMTAVSEDGESIPDTQPSPSYNLMFSRKLRENQADNSINPYKAQSEVLIFRLVPVDNGTRMVLWLRTPLKDRASKTPEERRNQEERKGNDERKNQDERKNANSPSTRPSSNTGNKQR
jgi:hypothetical protein